MKKRKIVHLANVEQTIDLFLEPQLAALIQLGYEVHAICPVRNLKKQIEAKGIIIHNVKVSRDITPIDDLLMFLRIWRIMMRERFYLVHAHSAKMEFFGQLAAWLSFTPYIVYTNHGMIFRSQGSKIKNQILRLMARISGWISDLIFSQSQEDIEFAQQNGIYSHSKMRYLGNGIDIIKFNRNRYSENEIVKIKKDVGIDPQKLVIGIVARFVKEKGYVEFIQAANELINRHKNIHFLCVGNEVEVERDPVDFELLNQFDLDHCFTILKSQKDMPKVYALMDIVSLPSYREGFPRTLMEAAAMSKATVATNISGCREAVVDGYNGILVPREDKTSLALALEDLIKNKQLRVQMGRNGRTLAAERFDQNKVIERLLEGYTELTGDKIFTSKTFS